jgi:hypothetical protein
MIMLQEYTLEGVREKLQTREFKNFGEELPIVTSCAVMLNAFGREGNIFSMCCNTGDLLKVTITAIPLLAHFTDC